MHVTREETCPTYFRRFTMTSVCLMDLREKIAEAETRREVTAVV